MQTEQIVVLLVAERDRLSRAIDALQGPTQRRGRPAAKKTSAVDHNTANVPDWVKPAAATVHAPAKRKAVVWDAAKKKAQSDKIKAYWAAKRKKAAKG
jgi:hypothetical protein